MKMLTIYLVRHGKTIFNEKHLIQGWCDSPLDKEGIEQADILHKQLSCIPFNACYVSPLGRAIETAEHIIAGRDIPIYINEDLKEFSFDSMEGDSEEELRNIYPVLQGNEVKGFDGESMPAFTKRILHGLDTIRNENRDGNILVVTHSGVITALLKTVSNLPEKDIIHINNCSVTKLTWNYGWKTVRK